MATIQMEFLSIDFQRNQIGWVPNPNIPHNGNFLLPISHLEAIQWGMGEKILPHFFPFHYSLLFPTYFPRKERNYHGEMPTLESIFAILYL